VYSRVLVNVGPAASVFANTLTEPGKAPVFVWVKIRRDGASLDFSQGGPNGSTANVRALVGITVLRHSTGEGPAPLL